MPNTYVNKVQKADGTTIMDITDTTATASDVASGKYFYLANGTKTQGTSTGGGGSVSQDANGYIVLSPTGTTPTLITKSITQNGTYNASSDSADGYSSVTVNVSGGGSMNTSTNFAISNNDYTLTFSNIQSAPNAFILLYDNDPNNYGLWINNHSVTSISYDGATTTALAMGDTTTYSATQEYYTFTSGELTWSYSSSQHKLTFNISTSSSCKFESNSDSIWGYKLYYV